MTSFFFNKNANEEHQSLIDIVQNYPEIFFRGPFLKLNFKKKKRKIKTTLNSSSQIHFCEELTLSHSDIYQKGNRWFRIKKKQTPKKERNDLSAW